MRRRAWVAVAALVALGACSTGTPTAAPSAAVVPVPAAPAAAVAAAAPVSCIQLTGIREARVVDDRTIDFVMNNRRVLRNTLPNACPGLGFERAFTYATSLSQLCSVDIITVLYNSGGPRRGASCGLGLFTPYTPVPKAR